SAHLYLHPFPTRRSSDLTLALEPADAARAMLHEALMGPAVAAVKLMSLDPFDAHRAFAATVGVADDLAARAASHADGPPTDLPRSEEHTSELQSRFDLVC